MSVPPGGGGYLVLTRPWPAMLRGIYGDPERYKQTYWSRFPGMYFAGDGAKRDADGYLWLLGRVDDVMNVAGHRISTTEVEIRAGRPQVRRRGGRRRQEGRDQRPGDLRVRDPQGGPGAVRRAGRRSCASTSRPSSGRSPGPKFLLFVPDLPKTRSGKIMRRLLRDIAEGRVARRHDHPRRRGRRRDHPRELRLRGGMTCRSTS